MIKLKLLLYEVFKKSKNTYYPFVTLVLSKEYKCLFGWMGDVREFGGSNSPEPDFRIISGCPKEQEMLKFLKSTEIKSLKRGIPVVTQNIPDNYFRINEILLKKQKLNTIPSTMYHGTSEEIGNRVWKDGLIPAGKYNRNFPQSKEGGIYLTTDFKTAEYFGKREKIDGIVIVTVNTTKLDPKKFRKDPSVLNSFIYFDKIPSEYIIDWKLVN